MVPGSSLSKRKKVNKHGFRSRNKKVLQARRRKGRKSLCPSVHNRIHF